MTKKSLNKLLSVILTLAICFTTVFGCLITANAADVASTCCEWSDGKVAEDGKSATINLTIYAPSDIAGYGIHTALLEVASKDDTLIFDGKKTEIIDGTLVSGGVFSADNYSTEVLDEDTIELATVTTAEDAVIEDYLLSSITLKFTFSFKDGVVDEKAKYYPQLTRLELADSFGNEYFANTFATDGLIKVGCDHVFDVAGCTPVQEKPVDGYYVYKDVPCVKCGTVNAYQVVPSTELKKVLYWDGTTSEPTTTDTEGNILITSAAELAYVTSNTVSGNYKIADNIDVIVLQPEATVTAAGGLEKLMGLTNYVQTKAYFESEVTFSTWFNGGTFQGTFDGNGVEIYGVYHNRGHGGLFATVYETTTIKNVVVKNSYISATDWAYAGAIVGRVLRSDAYKTKIDTSNSKNNDATEYITFEKCVVSGCYVSVVRKNYGGVLMGNGEAYINVAMRNCLVYDNHAVSSMGGEEGITAGVSGSHNCTWGGKNTELTDCIILDCIPYASQTQGQGYKPSHYTDVYTNQIAEHNPCGQNAGTSDINAWYTDGRIMMITKADVKGVAAKNKLTGLDWDTVWKLNEYGGYPVFDDSDVIVAVNGKTDFWAADNTIAEEYRVEGDNSGYTNGNMQLLNPDAENSESNPYIVETAEQLCYLIRGGKVVADNTQTPAKTDTYGKYYKVADGVSAFYLNKLADGTYIDANTSVDDIYKYMYTDGQGNNFGVKNYFQGHFDGNGVTIYGLAQGVTRHTTPLIVGLFPLVSGNASIKNVKLSKAFLCADDYAGGIIGQYQGMTLTDANDKTSGVITNLVVENCSVTDSYIRSTGNGGTDSIGAIIGNPTGWVSGVGNASVIINNCFIDLDEKYFNTYSEIVEHNPDSTAGFMHGGVVGYGGTNQVRISNTVVLGIKPYNTWKNNAATALGQHGAGADRFSNVYTDQLTGSDILCGIYTSSGKQLEYRQDYSKVIFNIAPSAIKGMAAKDALTGFDFENVWSYDGNGGYPTPATAIIPTTSQLNLNLLATNIDYKEDGTFNFNFYYEDVDGIGAPTLYVGRADGTDFTKLWGTKVDENVTENENIFANAGIDIGEKDIYKYTITNISARELGDTLLPTAVATNGKSTVYGKTEAICLSDYAKAVFDSNASDEDKNVVAALVNYGVAAKDALESSGSNTEATDTIYWKHWTTDEAEDSIEDLQDANDGSGDGSSWDKAIIIDNADELFWLCRVSTYDVTTNKYFKIADNIKNIILAPEDKIDGEKIMAMTDAEEIGEYLNSLNGGIGWNWDIKNGSFNGNFDGNGATIYGMRSDGLFGKIDCGVRNEDNYYTYGSTPVDYYYDNVGTVIKNINVKNSCFPNNRNTGGIVATTCSATEGEKVSGVINLENCSVTNSYFTGPYYGATLPNNNVGARSGNRGAFIGAANGHDAYKINNCITYGNKISITNTNTGIKDANGNPISVIDKVAVAGITSDRFQPKSDTDKTANEKARLYNTVTNSIILDNVTPYNLGWSNNSAHTACFSNVYTDQSLTFHNNYVTYNAVMTQITDRDSVKGTVVETTCSTLGWGNEWVADINGGYPILIQRAINGGIKTIYWKGDAGSETSIAAVNDTGASGTSWEEAIIIDNAEELYWVLRQAGIDNTVGKYFKIADGIDRIVLQPEGVLELDKLLACKDGAAVQQYFDTLKSAGTTLEPWCDQNSVFDGNIDGNGVEILGLYTETTKDWKVGLIGAWDGGNKGAKDATAKDYVGITVKNFTVGYSYMVSPLRLGVFGAQSQSDGWGAYVQGVLNLDTCAVINCYLKHTSTTYSYKSGSVGVITGECGGDVVKMNNMLIYGNNATDNSDNELWLKGNVRNDLKVLDENGSPINNEYVNNTVSNSIILGVKPYRTDYQRGRDNEPAVYSNVYTDQPAGAVTFENGTSYTYSTSQISHIEVADLVGSKSQSIVDKFNGVDGTTWYIGNECDGMPSFKPAGIMSTTSQNVYDNFKYTKYDDYGASNAAFGIYTTNINLKNNPYMGITFAIAGKYKEDRENIDITISTVDANGVETVIRDTDTTNNITDMNLPAFVEGQYISDPNGWTNKKNAGKYHLYTLKDLPVTDMCKSLKITMSYSGAAAEAQEVTAVISIEGFGNSKQNQYLVTGSEYYAKCAEAIKALLYYSKALNAKFGANS